MADMTAQAQSQVEETKIEETVDQELFAAENGALPDEDVDFD